MTLIRLICADDSIKNLRDQRPFGEISVPRRSA